jgi:hypothetical protein
MVKRIAKYLTLLLAIVVTAIGYANDSKVTIAEVEHNDVAIEFCESFIESPMQSGEISLSHQVTAPHTIQIQGTAKRTSNAHKNNFEFIAAGRAINTCIENHIFKKSTTINTSFTKPEHRLIRLGKLII